MKIYQLGEKLQFHSQYRGNFYLDTGWSIPEKNHRWSNGHEAEIIIRFRQLANNNLILRIRCSGYLANNAIEYQQVDVVVNLVKVGTWQVNKMDWYEVNIPRNLISDNVATIKLIIGSPISPAQYNLSKDNRQLGVNIDSLVIFNDLSLNFATDKMISAGHDAIGDVFESSGSYYRAIKHENSYLFNTLCNHGVYNKLINKNLIPEQFVREIHNKRYSHLVNVVSGCYVYVAKYPLLMLRDAAIAWISISTELLNHSETENYGLCDGHYGNFVQFNNARPKWCDIGSITNIKSKFEFGYLEFIRCYIIPLIAFTLPNADKLDIRKIIYKYGITPDEAIALFGEQISSWNVKEIYCKNDLRRTLVTIRQILEKLDFSVQKGFWSNYRNADALYSAYSGQLLKNSPDLRYESVMNLVRRSNTDSFIDIGCNDGIFSLMCVREGMKGIAIDLDEYAINKLYNFTKDHPEIELAIAWGGFLDVSHTADLTMALALSHHLVLSQKLTFDDVAKKLALISRKAAITEFMPDGLGGTSDIPTPYPNPLPKDYTLDNFISTLKIYFKLVEIINYPRRTNLANFSRRVLIYCEMPIR